ncbi:hypothetical protein [Duganella sp. HH105]|nr:hypothetical protein [Duganella sp. HH105]
MRAFFCLAPGRSSGDGQHEMQGRGGGMMGGRSGVMRGSMAGSGI